MPPKKSTTRRTPAQKSRALASKLAIVNRYAETSGIAPRNRARAAARTARIAATRRKAAKKK